MLYLFLKIFLVLFAVLTIHVGYINCRWKLWQWSIAMWYVAVVDKRTRNDFWHVVVDLGLISAGSMLLWVAIINR